MESNEFVTNIWHYILRVIVRLCTLALGPAQSGIEWNFYRPPKTSMAFVLKRGFFVCVGNSMSLDMHSFASTNFTHFGPKSSQSAQTRLLSNKLNTLRAKSCFCRNFCAHTRDECQWQLWYAVSSSLDASDDNIKYNMKRVPRPTNVANVTKSSLV